MNCKIIATVAGVSAILGDPWVLSHESHSQGEEIKLAWGYCQETESALSFLIVDCEQETVSVHINISDGEDDPEYKTKLLQVIGWCARHEILCFLDEEESHSVILNKPVREEGDEPLKNVTIN